MNPVTLKPGIGDGRPTATLYYGQDVRETLRTLPAASVHTVCTSPPYFGLRDYGKDGQIGLEDSPEDFVAALVEVFREVNRVLRPDGTMWVNLGDSYAGGDGYSPNSPSKLKGSIQLGSKGSLNGSVSVPQGLKPKDLVGIPWRVAFALQADGWYLRQDIIWAKGSCMPESVTDRCTKSHEYVFLLSKSDRYFFDNDAIKEPAVSRLQGRLTSTVNQPGAAARAKQGGQNPTCQGGTFTHRNRRSVWTVTTTSYKGAHFATWPPELVRPMVLAGCPVGGTVLDPFSGSATTGMVALQEGRNYVGIDLNPDYLPLAVNRVQELPAPQSDAPVEEGSTVFDLFGDTE